MGMFDSVLVKYPDCGEIVEFQSKAGDCSLKQYSIKNMPLDIACDLDGESKSCICGRVVKIKIKNKAKIK